jgi:ribonucleoside-diphosphate reductase beta chain
MTFESSPLGMVAPESLDVSSSFEVSTKPTTVADIVNARRVIDGPSDKLRAISATKYPWVQPLWDQMRGNRWEAQQVELVRDKQEFKQISLKQQTAIRRSLAFLSNLDAIQLENLSENVSHFITDPTISKLITRQAFEEAIHVDTYSNMIETIFDDPLEIYDMYRHVPELAQKNDFISAQSGIVTSVPTSVNKVKAIVSNIALEGIYFFSGFLVIYSVNRSTGKLNGMVDGIKYIQRDEMTHLDIFANAYLSCKIERPELFTKELEAEYLQILVEAAQREIVWFNYEVDGGIPGATEQQGAEFIWHRAESCANRIGLSINEKYRRQPIPWFDKFSVVNGTKGNFFETKIVDYTENKPTFTRANRRVAAG